MLFVCGMVLTHTVIKMDETSVFEELKVRNFIAYIDFANGAFWGWSGKALTMIGL